VGRWGGTAGAVMAGGRTSVVLWSLESIDTQHSMLDIASNAAMSIISSENYPGINTNTLLQRNQVLHESVRTQVIHPKGISSPS
jgi:hypothetical protein